MKSSIGQHIPAAPMPNAEATNPTEVLLSDKQGQHSRTALTSTSYCNLITTDYLSLYLPIYLPVCLSVYLSICCTTLIVFPSCN